MRKFIHKNQLILHLCLMILVLFILFPIFWVFISSLKSQSDFLGGYFWPQGRWHFENYWYAFAGEEGILRYYINSFLFTFFSVTLGIFIATLAGYALTRMGFKYGPVIFIMFLVVLMLPPQISLVPLFRIFQKLDLLYTPTSLFLPYVFAAVPLSLFLTYGYFRALPKELDEAAIMDGANHWQIYRLVTLPMSKPILATAVIISATGVWNEYLLASVFMRGSAFETLPVAIVRMTQNRMISNYPLDFATSILAFMPLIILFIFMQRFFIKGISGGAIKG